MSTFSALSSRRAGFLGHQALVVRFPADCRQYLVADQSMHSFLVLIDDLRFSVFRFFDRAHPRRRVGPFYVISLPHHFQRVAVADRLENDPAGRRDRDHERSVPDRYIELIQNWHTAARELPVLPLELCQLCLLELIGDTLLPRVYMQRRAPLPGGQYDRSDLVIVLQGVVLYKSSPCVFEVLIFSSCRMPGHDLPLSGAPLYAVWHRPADYRYITSFPKL